MSASGRSRMRRAMLVTSGPLRRTTPMPLRPGGVAIATMASSVANSTSDHPPRLLLPLRRNDHGLHEGISDALGGHRRIFGDCEVDNAPLVRIERAHFLRRAVTLCLVRQVLGHLLQLGVLFATIAVAVDDDALI